MTTQELEGRRILLVEDEYLQAREARELLERAGAEVVGPAGHAEDVPALLEGGAIDAAVIDINLGRGANYEIANTLLRRGVPFLFLTGYDDVAIPAGLADIPRIEKPATERRIIAQLAQLI